MKPPRIILAILAVFVLAAACSSESPSAPDRPLAVRAVAVREGPLHERLRYVGTARAVREVNVPARVAGTVVEVAPEGTFLRAGEPLVSISAPEMQARVSRTGAEVERARLDADYLCGRYSTDETLVEAGALARAQLDASRRACQTARAGVSALEAGLREVRAAGANSVEEAPFDGIVLKSSVEPGETVMPGKPLLSYGQRALEILVRVPEEGVQRGIRPGMKALVGSPPRVADTTVETVSPLAVGPARTIEVKLAMPEGLTAAHGMSVDVSFVLAESIDAVSVPLRALYRTGEQTYVLAVSGTTVKRVDVTPGIAEAGWVAVEPAPARGTQVVVGAPSALQAGMPVYVVTDEAAR